MRRRAFLALNFGALGCRALSAAGFTTLHAGAAHAQAGAEIEVIALRFRTADDLLPLLRPFVEPGGALTGQGSQLILRASSTNRAQIRKLLADLDRAPRQLIISLRQDRAAEETQRSIGANGSVTITNRRVYGNAQVEANNSRSLSTTDATQTIRVVEGGRAWIAMGTAIPLTFRQFVVTNQGLSEPIGTIYYEAVTGFHVRPTLAGDVVTLDIAPEQSTVTVRGLERAQLSTTVQGRLGEWIAVGGADVREDRSTSGTLQSSRGTERNQRGVWLRVDLSDQ
jgi:type II secretory pathway component GspD/PulD (secretin)